MPRRKHPLRYGVTSLWPLNISGEEWRKLETQYGYAIPANLRSAVSAKINTMRLLSDARQSAPHTREAIKRTAAIKRAAVDWLKWTEGLPPELEAMIMMSVETSEQAELVIKPFMKAIVRSCDERLSELEADLASKEAQDARHAWESWIAELTDLFDQYRLPTPARADVDKTDNQSPFTIFIWELQRLIEKQYRQHDHSIKALAKAINRARSPREGKKNPSGRVD